MRIVPRRTMNISSPASPSRKRIWRRRISRSRRRSTTAARSASENASKTRTSRRNARVSIVAATRRGDRGLGGHAADESVAELAAALAERRLGQARERQLDDRALGVAQLVLRQERLGRALQFGEKFLIDHDSPH